MEKRLPKAFHIGLDNDSTRLVLQRLIDADAPAMGSIPTTRALSTSAERAYRGLCADWFAFSGLSEDAMVKLDHMARCTSVESWLATRSSSYAPESFRTLGKALRWWASVHAVDTPLTPRRRAIRGTKPGRGRAIPLTPDQLLEVLEGLSNFEVLKQERRMRADFVEGWHLRMLAGITVTVTASLRPGSEVPQLLADGLTDGCVAGVSSDGLLLRINRTKSRHPRDILLRPRPDLLCPLSALQRWLQWCHQLELHRPGGRLLPSINVHKSYQPLGTANRFDAHQWSVITHYLQSRGHTMTNRTIHGCRAIMPTAAASQGWDPSKLRDLGAWARLDTAMIYVRDHEINDVSALLGGDAK